MKVKVHSKNGSWWYSDHVNETFTVRAVFSDAYLVKASDGYTNYILKKHCEECFDSVKIENGVWEWQRKHIGCTYRVLRKNKTAVWVDSGECNSWFYLSDVTILN